MHVKPLLLIALAGCVWPCAPIAFAQNTAPRPSLEFVVTNEAVVYRGKLWEAGFRALAAGYPGQVNLAFDAEEMRLALLWRGRFLNPAPHWTVQGMGSIRPVGSNVVIFPHGTAFAVLKDQSAPWPAETAKELGAKFRGYQLDALQRPTLLYSFRGVEVEDFATGVNADGKQSLKRKLKFTGSAPDGLHLKVAEGKFKSFEEKNAWRLDDALTIRVPAGIAFLRGEGEQRELLVPLLKGRGKTENR